LAPHFFRADVTLTGGAWHRKEILMFAERKSPPKPLLQPNPDGTKPVSITLLTIVGEYARMEGKFDITDSIQIECEIGGELNVGGKLVIGEKGVVHADVQTVDAVIMGHYEGNMIATGNVEIAETGRVTGNVQTDSLVISKGGFFNGNITKMNETTARQVVAIEEKRGNQQFASR
jgi:cytoskeletal protein CcmA (bactofilin family)